MALVEVVGLGYVGLTTALVLHRAGHEVVGIDSDPRRVALLTSGRPSIAEPGVAEVLQGAIQHSRPMTFRLPGANARTAADVVAIAVPVNADDSGLLDTDGLRNLLLALADRTPHLVIVRSTLTPGTSSHLLSSTGLAWATNSYVHWPEFLNQGRALIEASSPDRLVFGADSAMAASKMQSFLDSVHGDGVPRFEMSTVGAEASKHLANAALATIRVFAGEAALIAGRLGLDPAHVMSAVAADYRLDHTLLRPRPGLTDSCLRKDLLALSASLGGSQLLDHVAARGMEQRAVCATMLSDARGIIGNGSDVSALVVGMGFEPGVGDTANALSEDLLPIVQGLYPTSIWDPVLDPATVPHGVYVHNYDALPEAVATADLIVLIVDYPELGNLDWEGIAKRMSMAGGLVINLCDAEPLRSLAEHPRVRSWTQLRSRSDDVRL